MSWGEAKWTIDQIKAYCKAILTNPTYTIMTSTTWKPPVSGLYRVWCIGKGGDGNDCYVWSGGYYNVGAGGGAGGAGYLEISLDQATSYDIVVNENMTTFASNIKATAGANAKDISNEYKILNSGGDPGVVTGDGNITVLLSTKGSDGACRNGFAPIERGHGGSIFGMASSYPGGDPGMGFGSNRERVIGARGGSGILGAVGGAGQYMETTSDISQRSRSTGGGGLGGISIWRQSSSEIDSKIGGGGGGGFGGGGGGAVSFRFSGEEAMGFGGAGACIIQYLG